MDLYYHFIILTERRDEKYIMLTLRFLLSVRNGITL